MKQQIWFRNILPLCLVTKLMASTFSRSRKLRGYDTVTHIANAPDFMKGVINLRGVIVPIVDMRIKFKVGEPTYHEFTVVIIMNVLDRVIGMVVDSVSDVVTLTPEQIRPAPEMGAALDTNYITGLGTQNEQMLILVDIEKLMSSEEMQLIEPFTLIDYTKG